MSQQTWNQFYKKRGRFNLGPHPNLDQFLRFVTHRFTENTTGKLLDIGCGSGRNAILASKQNFHVTAIDFSQEAINLTNKWAEEESIELNTAIEDCHSELRYNSNSFDAVLAIDSLIYSNFDDLKITIEEIKRILKPDGYVFFSFPTQNTKSLILHLVLSEDEIFELLKHRYKVEKQFTDLYHQLCFFCKPI